jgi:ATP/maltotriose-dependent transcriptional regulator MalT
MHDAVRDLRAEADSKMRALQATIRHAEEASARLEAAIVNAQRSGAVEDDDLELLRQLGDEVASQASSSRTWASGVQLPAVLPHEMGQVPLWQQRQVLDLAHQGTSAAQIAETIAISLGDVELILSMSDHPS